MESLTGFYIILGIAFLVITGLFCGYLVLSHKHDKRQMEDKKLLDQIRRERNGKK